MSGRYTNPVRTMGAGLEARAARKAKLDALKAKGVNFWWEADPESAEPLSERLEMVLEDQAIIADEQDQEAAAVVAPAGLSETARAALVQTIQQAHPGIITELLRGETADEVLASIPAARAAYDRVAAGVAKRSPVAAGGVAGAAGARAGARPVDTAKLSPIEKITMGLRQNLGGDR